MWWTAGSGTWVVKTTIGEASHLYLIKNIKGTWESVLLQLQDKLWTKLLLIHPYQALFRADAILKQKWCSFQIKVLPFMEPWMISNIFSIWSCETPFSRTRCRWLFFSSSANPLVPVDAKLSTNAGQAASYYRHTKSSTAIGENWYLYRCSGSFTRLDWIACMSTDTFSRAKGVSLDDFFQGALTGANWNIALKRHFT